MARSKPKRGKKYRPSNVYGKRIVAQQSKWIRVAKNLGYILLAVLMLMVIASILIKHFRHLTR